MRFNLRKFVVGPLRTNVYMVLNHEYAILIDSGPGSLDRVLYYVDRESLKLHYILLTHGHFDHVSDAQYIKEVSSAKIVMHENDLPILMVSKDISRYFNVKWKDPDIDILLRDEEEIRISNLLHVKVIHTPGHTPGSVCYYFTTLKSVFTGDTLFKETVGRTDFPEGSPYDLAHSLRKLIKLPNDVIVYPGHGDKASMGYIKANNIYISDLLSKLPSLE